MRLLKICSTCLSMILFANIAVSCGNPATGNGGDSSSPQTEMEYTEKVFFKNGTTDYKIVTQENYSSTIDLAVSELTDFFAEATDCSLRSVLDTYGSWNAEDTIISVGNTAALASAGIEVKYDTLDEGGYVIKTVGNSIFIAGATDYGTLWGVYEFLERLFDWKTYAADEIDFTYKSESKVPLFDIVTVPTIATRVSPHWMLWNNTKYGYRLKMRSWNDLFISVNGSSMATMFALFPKDKYFATHREYYNSDGDDMCHTNMEFVEEYVENLKPYVLAQPEKTYFMYGQEDNCHTCTCKTCQDTIARYGGADSATVLLAANYVEEKINEWLKEIGDTRTIKFFVFAYHETLEAPVTYDESTKEYSPLLRANDNVYIMIAPLGADFSKDYSHEDNATEARAFEQWTVCTDNLVVWSYSTNFRHYLIDYPNWEMFYKQYDFYAQHNVKLLFEQGQASSGQYDSTTFLSLRAFLQAELSFDSKQDYNTLVDEWFTHYFRAAKDSMYRYYSELRDLHQYNMANNGLSGGVYVDLKKAKYWPKATLLRWLDYIEEAYEDIKPLQNEQADLYERLYDRINKESLMVRYLLIELYGSSFTDEELYTAKKSFENDIYKYKIGYLSESTKMSAFFSTWY